MQSELYNKLLVLECSVHLHTLRYVRLVRGNLLLTVVLRGSATETAGKPCSWNRQ